MENQRNTEGNAGHNVFYEFMGGGSGGPMRRCNLSYSSIGAITMNHPYSRHSTFNNNPSSQYVNTTRASTMPFRQAEMNQLQPAAAAPDGCLANMFGLFGHPYGSYMLADGTVVYPGMIVEMAGSRQAGDDDMITMSNRNEAYGKIMGFEGVINHPFQFASIPSSGGLPGVTTGTYNASPYGRRVGVPRTSKRRRMRAFADYINLRNPWLRLTEHHHETIADSHRRYAAMHNNNSHLYRYNPDPPFFRHYMSDLTLVDTDASREQQSSESVDQQLPPRTYNPRTMCYFCLYDVSSSIPFGRRACGHLFHLHCVPHIGLRECYLCRAYSGGGRRST